MYFFAWPTDSERDNPAERNVAIAAEKVQRSCFGMELDAVYVDVACRRWRLVMGTEPILEATGATFSEVANGQAAA